MKHTVRLLLALVLTLSLGLSAPAALAQEDASPLFASIPAERLYVGQLPEGMIYDDLSEEGVLHLLIDNDATDWPTAVAHMTFPAMIPDPQVFQLDINISLPKGAAMSRLVLGDAWGSDEELYQQLTSASTEHQSRFIGLWFDLVQLNHNQQKVTPVQTGCNPWNTDQPFAIAVQWLDENENELFCEKVILKLAFTNPLVSHSFGK